MAYWILFQTYGVLPMGLLPTDLLDCVNFGSEFILSFNVGGLSTNIIGRARGPMGGLPPQDYRA